MECSKCTRTMMKSAIGDYYWCACGALATLDDLVGVDVSAEGQLVEKVQVQNVYRLDHHSLVQLSRVKTKPGHGEYMVTDNGLLVFGKCRNGQMFEVTFTRGCDPFHKQITIADSQPFVRLKDL